MSASWSSLSRRSAAHGGAAGAPVAQAAEQALDAGDDGEDADGPERDRAVRGGLVDGHGSCSFGSPRAGPCRCLGQRAYVLLSWAFHNRDSRIAAMRLAHDAAIAWRMFRVRAMARPRGNEQNGPRMRVIGIDPGLRRTGWGVVDVEGTRLRHVANGVCVSEGRRPRGAALLAARRADRGGASPGRRRRRRSSRPSSTRTPPGR